MKLFELGVYSSQEVIGFFLAVVFLIIVLLAPIVFIPIILLSLVVGTIKTLRGNNVQI